MNNRQKERTRAVIRVCMILVAVVLLVFALGVPIANNAVALGIQNDLKALPLPADTTLVEATSAAGKLTGNGNGMQYFGAILLHSDLSREELEQHYAPYRQSIYDCCVEEQTGQTIRPAGEDLHGDANLTFSTDMEGEGWYIVYTWGEAPAAWRVWLDADLRGH